jgi:aspartate racemase
MQPKRVLGVLGGMGPLATVAFMRQLVQSTPAQCDQEHVAVVVSSIPQVPDRTQAFRGEGVSPLPALQASAHRLTQAGAGLIVMPCNTAHLWFDDLQATLPCPMLHLVDAGLHAALTASPLAPEPLRLGLLATDATLASGLYVNRAALKAPGRVSWVMPTATEMLQWVMPGIEAVKCGQLLEARDQLGRAAHALQMRGAQRLMLGCTEIPLALDEATCGIPLIDPTVELACQAVAWARSNTP